MNYLLGELTDDEDFLELYNQVLHPRKERVFRERENHFEKWCEKEFIQRFRLSKNSVRLILEEISGDITTQTHRNKAVTPEEMLLLTLRYYATGSILQVVGDFMGVHKSTAGQIVQKVSIAIATRKCLYIHFPTTPEEILEMRQKFFKISKFPRCIGAIDCTHVKIQSPGGENAETFRNRKAFFSLNVQAICDPQLKFTNIVARWPGATHDSTVFNNSHIRAKFENGELGDNIIVGDGGYGIKSYLITPLLNPVTPAEQLFNEAQIRTRNCIERCFGVWKRRFPILALGIKVNIENVQPIIVACAVLHNIACYMGDEIPQVEEEIEAAINFSNDAAHNAVDAGGINNITRFSLIQDYFAGLL